MKRGFTLIEMLVAITIFSIMTTFIIANYAVNERVTNVKNQVAFLVSDLEQAQNMAMTGILVNDTAPLAYQLVVDNCPTQPCSIQIKASSTEGLIPIKELPLNKVSIKTKDNAQLVVEYRLPRGKMSLGEAATAWIELFDGDIKYCVTLSAISGRLSSQNNACPEDEL